MSKKRKPSQPVDRAAEYIDSPLMTQRLRYDRDLSARIAGNYGTYRTRVRVGDRDSAHCTCPSDEWPCKHARALEATWNQNPESFFDLFELLKEFADRSQAELLDFIGQMAMVAPESLVVFGIDEFDAEVVDDEYD